MELEGVKDVGTFAERTVESSLAGVLTHCMQRFVRQRTGLKTSVTG